MAFPNPDDPNEILYGGSGDVRNEINAFASVATAGHYADEAELPGSLIVRALRRATRLIDFFLEPVYPDNIPITAAADVPRIFDEISSDIATYYVIRTLRAKLGTVSEEQKKNYFDQYVSEEPPGYLVLVRNGKTQIPELKVASPDEAKSVRALGRHPVFDIQSDLAQGPDWKLLDDIAQERDS